MAHSNSVAQPVPPFLPFLPEEVWLLILSRLDETTKAICMNVCPEWRSWILIITRSVIPHIFEKDLACSISLLKWQRDFLVHHFTENTCAFAAKGGHLDILQYLRANGCPWDEWTCARAANNGHLDILQYAHENGCPWNELTCFGAARGGYMNIMLYAHANGCPWDEETCSAAAFCGHLDILQYAHENGCPWDELVCLNAEFYGHMHILEYARANGCPE